ncbi:IclR family transcriptional regulator [Haloarchaeobius sp. DFWS5]|uniref:IclR family transcriptional regulator n=1 Tax=Haloarchaeobius sp. DFWS5 TaxID=3446114 RepID=UPI003EBD4B3B
MTEYPVSAVKRSHDIVDVLVERGTVGVTEVADAVGIPKSTAHDHLRTLERVGSVVNDGGSYRLSTRYLHVGQRARNANELFVQGRDETLALSDAVGEGTYVQLVTAEHGRSAILLAPQSQRERFTQNATTYPRRPPLHTNAPGKAILANEDDETVERIVTDHGLPAWTRETITDEPALRTELDRIGEAGYAVDNEELIPGMVGVAAPIVTGETVHGAIAIYTARSGLDGPIEETTFVKSVQESADEIQANLIFSQD